MKALSDLLIVIFVIYFITFILEGEITEAGCVCGRGKKGEHKSTKKRERRWIENRIGVFWIISAAHCFCAMNPCTYGIETKINFNKSIVTAYLGQHDISRRFYNKKNIFHIDEIVIYPSYTPSNFHNDIALLKVDRQIRFNKYRMSICLPMESIKDTKIHAYVSGWGLLQGQNCTTNDEGPVKHQPCSLPFMWKGIKISKCVHTLTPSSGNPKCKDYKQSLSNNELTKNEDRIELIHEDDTRSECYSESPKEYGWCATCVNDAVEGEPGFCGPIKNKKRKERRKNYGRPSFDQNWGWCSKNCMRRNSRNDRTNILQETRLYWILTLKFVQEIKRNTKALKRQLSSKFYFGGSDSCTGDSGGPLYTWKKRYAVLIGIVSRGYGCALYNQAGVYARISAKLSWIKDIIKDGDCTASDRSKNLRKLRKRGRRKKSRSRSLQD
ncbi:unnamed protein product [Lepeophtheirus salmonis]|uniref:(salmon louse) hypothetical protein n=1 Tax=Lepeophtheirus salmonis TaxID=72036 RepID=A0A7R8CL19_LEPSM|nr:unnamed protein product [Lepeophtheirus salmonis]CAF2850841.1 unnamed protein product [Lepeophtheirus salmonis]